jgi:hypothetical protein
VDDYFPGATRFNTILGSELSRALPIASRRPLRIASPIATVAKGKGKTAFGYRRVNQSFNDKDATNESESHIDSNHSVGILDN